MMPPTSIDGTDITGATIDGTDVQEITVDGDTVFSAGPPFIVAAGNLIAWYPFTNQADDETRTGGILDNQGISVGDSTDYSPNTIQPTYQTSGGVTDLQTGPSSAYYDFTATEKIITPSVNIGSTDIITVTGWVEPTTPNDSRWANFGISNNDSVTCGIRNDNGNLKLFLFEKIGGAFDDLQITTTKTYQDLHFLGYCFNSVTNEKFFYLDGNKVSPVDTMNNNLSQIGTPEFHIGSDYGFIPHTGLIDDVRVYNKELSQSEFNTIFQKTKP
jgi:hypothetical protein